jgi:hypothetical protein
MSSRNSARPWWMLCVLLGLATIGFGVWFTGAVPETGCTIPPRPGVTALLLYQMARTPAEIEGVFGRAGDPCRPAMVAALDRVNTVDLVGFIATYGAFLATFLFAMVRSGGGRPARVGLFLLVGGLALDVLETAAQLRITRELPGSQASLTALAIGSAGKFTLLALVCLFAGLAMMVRGGIVGWIAGAGCIIGGVLAIVGLVDPGARGLLPAGNGLAWLLMFLYAVVAALRPSRASERGRLGP